MNQTQQQGPAPLTTMSVALSLGFAFAVGGILAATVFAINPPPRRQR